MANHATKCNHAVIGPVDQAFAIANVVSSIAFSKTRALRAASLYAGGSYLALTRGKKKKIYRDPVHLSGHCAAAATLWLEIRA